MDLAKIIGELRVELQCLDAAIASIEHLARVQNVAESDIRQVISGSPQAPVSTPVPESEAQPVSQSGQPVKRRRGRPPKHTAPPSEDEPQPIPPVSAPSDDDDSSASAA